MRVESRDHVGVVASLRPFFEPKSVAVIGASRRRGTIGGELFRNILEADFKGVAYPVNRNAEPVAGVRAYSTIDELPELVDLAVICLPGGQVLETAEAALRHGVRALCVISAGFAETGHDGRARQDRLLALVRAHGARLLGPNCLGIAVPVDRPQRHLCAAPSSRRPHRLLVAERRARTGAAREGDRARARLLRVCVDREQGRRLVERPARVVGGRRAHEPRAAVPRVVRQPAHLRSSRAPGRAPQADPRAQGGYDLRRRARRQLAHRGACRLRRRRRCALPPGRRAASTNARGADRRRRAALLAAAAAGAARRRDHECGRARNPLRRRMRGRRARVARPFPIETRAALASLVPGGGEPRATRSTCSARRPLRPTRRWSAQCSPIRTSTR